MRVALAICDSWYSFSVSSPLISCRRMCLDLHYVGDNWIGKILTRSAPLLSQQVRFVDPSMTWPPEPAEQSGQFEPRLQYRILQRHCHKNNVSLVDDRLRQYLRRKLKEFCSNLMRHLGKVHLGRDFIVIQNAGHVRIGWARRYIFFCFDDLLGLTIPCRSGRSEVIKVRNRHRFIKLRCRRGESTSSKMGVTIVYKMHEER